MRFRFTGKIKFNDDNKDRPSLRTGKTKDGDEYKLLNLGITTDKSNWAFVELFGMKSDEIKTMDVDNNKFDVDWEDRFNEDIVESVASYKKTYVNLSKERGDGKGFVSSYDAVEYIVDNIETLSEATVCITGDVNKNEYNGRLSDRFIIRSLYVVDENDVRPSFRTYGRYFFTKEDIDDADWKEDKKLAIDGYINTYMSSEKANKYVKHPAIFDASKVDYNNEDHIKVKDYKLRQLGIAEEDGKIANKLKSNKVYALDIEFAYLNGAEQTEFDMDTLTENQKVAIELGLKTVDDFRPKGDIYGDRKVEYKIVGFDLRNESADGVFELGETMDEFNDNVYIVTSKADSDDNNDEPEVDDGVDDLFS